MPPKKDAQKVKKVVEDKTFGMKNKNKSKKVQEFVKQVEVQAKHMGRSHKEVMADEAARAARKAKKEAEALAAAEMNTLFKKVVDAPKIHQQMDAAADPKSVLCAYFKAGNCIRGSKCKFSHDLSLDRKTAKINVYEDPRAKETMDDWDQSKLEEVVLQKQGSLPPTNIVCKYFIEAIETRKYGWLWVCPSGKDCHYRHALPPGFVLKKKKTEEDEDADEDKPTIEDEIEEERKKLDPSKLTPMTQEIFDAWKREAEEKRVAEVERKAEEIRKSKGSKAHAGAGRRDMMSGRDLFTYDPSLFIDDDEAAADDDYVIRETGISVDDVARDIHDASLFLDDDVELPEDEEEEEEEEEDGGEDEEDEEEKDDGEHAAAAAAGTAGAAGAAEAEDPQ